jgi:hypothetical protein
MFRITLRHRDDGNVLITTVKADTISKARKAIKKFLGLYIVNTVIRVS